MDPKMIERQISLMKKNFASYPSSKDDTELRVKECLETKIWPLVNHIRSFDFPREVSLGILKLVNFPLEKPEEEKWVNKFACEVNHCKYGYYKTFTEEEAKSMDSDLGEIMNALKHLEKALPFISIHVEDKSDEGKIIFNAFDKILEDYNLVRIVGGTE